MKHNPKQIRFKCIPDDDPAYTAQLAKEVYALCPPLRPVRFDQRIWRLWGLDISAYPADSLIIIGGDGMGDVGETGSLVLSPKHRLIWMKTYQTSIFTDAVPKSFSAEQYALFYRFLMMDDPEGFRLYLDKYQNTFNVDFRCTVDFILALNYYTPFDVRTALIEYVDKVKFDVLLCSISKLISNLRYDAVSLYILKELRSGRLLYFTKKGEMQPERSSRNDYLVPFGNMIEPDIETGMDTRYSSIASYLTDNTHTYPMPSSESVVAGWFSTCLKFDQEDVNNALIKELFRNRRDKEDIDRFKEQLEINNYYGYTLVREFLTNPMREMPALEKIGMNFRATSKQSDIPLLIEPFSNSYAIDTVRTDETCRVYETGHDDYYFTEIERPVESPVAGPDGYAMILDRTESIYGYIPKSKVRPYTDNDLLNEKIHNDPTKSKKGVINDTDGYVNIRKEKHASSAIIGKLTGQEFCYWELPGNWFIVEVKDGLRGFVHKDHIREKFDANRWIIK
jgi:hypothetical protein